MSKWRYVSIGSDNGLVPNRWQTIMWPKDHPVYRRIYASSGLNQCSSHYLSGSTSCLLIRPTICITMMWNILHSTVECRYSTTWYNIILHTALEALRQNINQMLKPQRHHIPRPDRRAMGVSFVNMLENIGRIITVPHCMFRIVGVNGPY